MKDIKLKPDMARPLGSIGETHIGFLNPYKPTAKDKKIYRDKAHNVIQCYCHSCKKELMRNQLFIEKFKKNDWAILCKECSEKGKKELAEAIANIAKRKQRK